MTRPLVFVLLVLVAAAAVWLLGGGSNSAEPGMEWREPEGDTREPAGAIDGLEAAGAVESEESVERRAVEPADGAVADPVPPGVARLTITTWDVANDQPAKLVNVDVRKIGQNWPWPVLAEENTGDAGRVTVEVPAHEAISLIVARGRDFISVGERYDAFEPGVHEIEIRLHPQPVAGVLFRVRNENGEPIEGAEVSYIPTRSHPERGFRYADSKGEVFAEIHAGWGDQFEITAEGYARLYRRVEAGEEDIVVTLEAEAILVGTIVDEAARPVTGARVSLRFSPRSFGISREPSSLSMSSSTDALGRFQLSGLKPGVPSLIVAWDQERAIRQQVAPLEAGRNERTFKLSARPILRGIVLDEERRPLAHIGIELRSHNQLRRVDPNGSTVTRPIRADDLAYRSSHSDGTFVFNDSDQLSAGDYEIGTEGALSENIRADASAGFSYAYLPFRDVITLMPGEQHEPYEIVLRRGKFISGHLLGPDRKPMKSAYLRALPEKWGGARVKMDVSAEDGSFSIGPLSEGNYKLTGGSYTGKVRGEWEGIAAGTEGVELVCDASASVQGRLIGVDGKPTTGRVFGLTQIDGETEMWGPQTDGDGRFEMVAQPGQVFSIFGYGYDGSAGWLIDVPVRTEPGPEVILKLERAVKTEFVFDQPYEEGTLARITHRSTVIYEGDPFYLFDMHWFAEGELRIDLLLNGEIVETVTRLLVVGDDQTLTFFAE